MKLAEALLKYWESADNSPVPTGIIVEVDYRFHILGIPGIWD